MGHGPVLNKNGDFDLHRFRNPSNQQSATPQLLWCLPSIRHGDFGGLLHDSQGTNKLKQLCDMDRLWCRGSGGLFATLDVQKKVLLPSSKQGQVGA